MSNDETFQGFELPVENWCRLPLALIENLHRFDSKAELSVVLYILRHTWGYKEYDEFKHLTMDDFVNGRKRANGTRMDSGTGLSEPSVRTGLASAAAHGFIKVEVDDHDKARVKKLYKLAMSESGAVSNDVEDATVIQGVKSLPPDPKEFTPWGKEVLPRTEKETIDRNSGEVAPALTLVEKTERIAPTPPRKPVDRVKDHPLYQAFNRGYNDKAPEPTPHSAPQHLIVLAALETLGATEKQVEDYTRLQVLNPKRTSAYKFTYLADDLSNQRAMTLARDTKPKPKGIWANKSVVPPISGNQGNAAVLKHKVDATREVLRKKMHLGEKDLDRDLDRDLDTDERAG